MRESFRDAARAAGLPDETIDWWLPLARPRLHLSAEGDGPVLGRFGGTAAAPLGQLTFLASVDLAAIPAGSHDLDLPRDGHLLFYSEQDITPEKFALVHASALPELEGSVPLYGRVAWMLPAERWESTIELPDGDHDEQAIREVVDGLHYDDGILAAIGGYGLESTSGIGNPVDSPAKEALVAQLFLRDDRFDDLFGGSPLCLLSYLIDHDDLAARRFDQTRLVPDFNG